MTPPRNFSFFKLNSKELGAVAGGTGGKAANAPVDNDVRNGKLRIYFCFT